ncbi:MAG TPA: GNAT family protein, partial [Acidimicrobiales bacterium]|nr:GNAT family protein [Acidimicrobiales bacterium]
RLPGPRRRRSLGRRDTAGARAPRAGARHGGPGLLAEHLFATTPAHRLVALTEADNVAEQRSLEKCAFRREGLLRQGGFRGGAWRDVVVYGRLRDDT